MSISNARGFSVDGGINNVVHGNQNTTNYFGDSTDKYTDLLATKAATNAFHDSEQRYPPPNCHPGTRTEVLVKLSKWIEGNSHNTRIYWVYGPAGVGKSAIAQALAEKYASNRLAGCFFFSRNDTSRDKLDPFVATVAYQLLKSDTLRERLGSFIIQAIRSDPNIFHTSVENQFQKLILEPCSKLNSAEWQHLPNVIIIDGLDECTVFGSQARLLALIRGALAISFGLIFIVCSRPEPLIRHGFNHQGFVVPLDRIEVGDSNESDEDITVYLRHEFASVREKHHMAFCHLPETTLWPNEDVIQLLVRRACGQFIFAVTVVKYVDTMDDLPQERLKTILALRTQDLVASPYPELDVLYQQILSTCHNWVKVRLILRLLITPYVNPKQILGRVLSLDNWRCAWTMSRLLNFRDGEVGILLSRLHSVLFIPDDELSDIHILHASFTEFLQDPVRSGKYHIQRYLDTEYLDLVAVLLLKTVSRMEPQYLPQFKLDTSVQLQRLATVACWSWAHFCLSVDSPSTALLAAMDEFNPHFAVSLALHLGTRYNLFYALWHAFHPLTLLSWAKALTGQKPLKFIEKFESFSDGFHIGFHPSSGSSTLGVVLALASVLGGESEYSELCREFLNKLYLTGYWYKSPQNRFIAISPISSPIHVPAGWVVVDIVPEKGRLFNKLIASLLSDPGQGDTEPYERVEILVDDIKDDTEDITGGNLDKQRDLIYLKGFLADRRQEVGLLDDWSTPNSSLPRSRTSQTLLEPSASYYDQQDIPEAHDYLQFPSRMQNKAPPKNDSYSEVETEEIVQCKHAARLKWLRILKASMKWLACLGM